MSRRGGFTLLEVLIVIGLLAILGGVALLGYRPMLSRLRLNEAARQVVMDLKMVRVSAIAESADHRVHFAVPGATYQRERKLGSSYEAVGPPTPLPFGVRVIDCTAVGSSITFRPRGHASTFGSVTLLDPEGEERRIVVDIAGRMRVD
jgi:prepilin-type N-terminal cleavage/methylation domain-containing protein